MSTDKPDPEFIRLLNEILAAGKAQGLDQKDMALRAKIQPGSLSRMKRRGRGRFDVLSKLGRQVGLRLALVPDRDQIETIRKGALFK